jgi:putative intracellular protease/amidase
LKSGTAPVARFSSISAGTGSESEEKEGRQVAKELQGQKVAFLATDGVEQVELTEPWKAVEEAGAEPEFVEEGKPVGVICHGPWTLVEADVVRDRKLT